MTTMRTNLLLSTLLIGAFACADAANTAPTTIALTDAALTELPTIVTDTGALICAADGYSPCPFNQAVANRLEDGRIALWEPGQPVMILNKGDTGRTLLADAVDRPYNAVIAISSTDRDRFQLLDFTGVWRAITLSLDGTVHRIDTLADPGLLTSIGFVGSRVIRQKLTGWDSDSGGRMSVAILNKVTDTVGTTILDAPVGWLRGGTADQPPLPPIVAANPVWALTREGDIIWSPGDRLMIERRTRRGAVRWRIDGNLSIPVSAADLDAREAAIRDATSGLPLVDVDFAGMRERSDSVLPAVTGINVTPTGVILAALATPPTADSVSFLRIGPDGQPLGRLRLSGDTRILLAEGDSLLVHRPMGETQLREIRWLQLVTPAIQAQ